MIDQIIQDLMEQKGYTEQQANKILFTKGLKIYSVQDMAIQQICDEEFSNLANFPREPVGVDYASASRPRKAKRSIMETTISAPGIARTLILPLI